MYFAHRDFIEELAKNLDKLYMTEPTLLIGQSRQHDLRKMTERKIASHDQDVAAVGAHPSEGGDDDKNNAGKFAKQNSDADKSQLAPASRRKSKEAAESDASGPKQAQTHLDTNKPPVESRNNQNNVDGSPTKKHHVVIINKKRIGDVMDPQGDLISFHYCPYIIELDSLNRYLMVSELQDNYLVSELARNQGANHNGWLIGKYLGRGDEGNAIPWIKKLLGQSDKNNDDFVTLFSNQAATVVRDEDLPQDEFDVGMYNDGSDIVGDNVGVPVQLVGVDHKHLGFADVIYFPQHLIQNDAHHDRNIAISPPVMPVKHFDCFLHRRLLNVITNMNPDIIQYDALGHETLVRDPTTTIDWNSDVSFSYQLENNLWTGNQSCPRRFNIFRRPLRKFSSH